MLHDMYIYSFKPNTILPKNGDRCQGGQIIYFAN